MKLLLDTCALLWFLTNERKLSPTAKSALDDPANERLLSPISLLEIALKNRIGKLPLPATYGAMFPRLLTANRIRLLPLEPEYIEPLTTMPLHHRDPFDRLIGATALVERLTLLSADAAFDVYGLRRLW